MLDLTLRSSASGWQLQNAEKLVVGKLHDFQSLFSEVDYLYFFLWLYASFDEPHFFKFQNFVDTGLPITFYGFTQIV